MSTRPSDSLNGIASVRTETVPSFETSTSVPDGRNSGDLSAAASTLARAAATSSFWEASARTTRSAVVPSDGNASLRSCMVLASGIELGRVSRLPLCVFMPRAGIASSTTTTVASSSEIAGCRTTGRRMRPLIEPGRIRRITRCSSGTRGRSTQRPSLASSAGSTVIEPSTATATTMIEPTASELNVESPMMNNPAIEQITAAPDTRIECPEVWAAISTASRLEWPLARSSRSRLR